MAICLTVWISATPLRVYTFSAEIAVCTHSNHRALRKEETLHLFYHRFRKSKIAAQTQNLKDQT